MGIGVYAADFGWRLRFELCLLTRIFGGGGGGFRRGAGKHAAVVALMNVLGFCEKDFEAF